MEYMTIGFKKSVSLVLLPIDDFTDRIITDSQLRMYTEEEKKPSIRKADGYHVFCDLQGTRTRICVEGPLYQKQTVEINLKETPEIVKIRMLPEAGYSVPAGVTCVKGVLPAGSRLRFYFPEQKKSCKLLYDYDAKEGKKELAVFLAETMHLEGKTLCIKNHDTMEFFKVIGQKEEIIIAEQPLKRSYKKIGTSIFPVYEAFAGEDGKVYLPIRMVYEEENPCFCLLQRRFETEEHMAVCTLLRGKENKITEQMFEEREEG